MSFVRSLAGLVATLAAGLCLMAPADADLRAFNTAVSAGDFKTASSVAAETWPQLSKADDSINAVAREFAWASMLANEPGRAQAYTSFLIGKSSTLPPDDPSIVTWRVLDSWATFAVRPSALSRKALSDALQVRTAIAGKDLISLRASQALFRDEWSAGLWRDASAVAESGAKIARDFGPDFVDTFYQLEMGRLAASFVDRATPEAAQYLKDLAKMVYADALAASDRGLRERLISTFFAVDAWAEATSMRQVQQGKRGIPPDVPDSTVPSRLTPAPGDAAVPECQVTRAAGAKQPNFPANKKFQGWPGFATYRLTLGEGGRFSEVKLMGAAPHTDLAGTVGVAIGEWRWQFAGPVQPPACRMPVYYYLAFQFDVPS